MQVGQKFGTYEVIAKIGEGGMGDVFRARDTQLGRDVAIKVLPDSFARDADRVARFRREAQTLAALNDPHIAQVYQFEETAQAAALVMEFVDGRTLAEVIASAAAGLPLDDALALARQIAAGLEVAHERGIVHRDLKPANIKITPERRVKLLDFGLAKALDGGAASGDQLNSPTLTARATEAGTILGTAAYMSPEQARGRHVDKRTDIWAFGAVLFEMLTGRRLFDGETVSDAVAAVLRSDPDWTQLPAETPPHVRALLARCLERDASRRLRDIGEARFALDTNAAPVATAPPSRDSSSASVAAPAVTRRAAGSSSIARLWQRAAAMLALTTILFGALALWQWRQQAAVVVGASMELAITAPDDARFVIGNNAGNIVLSPDGTRVAFVAAKEGPRQMWIRSLAADDARPLSGTDGASYPFWSPDGRRIGFFSSRRLLTVDVAGGLPETIAEVSGGGRGGAWGADGIIVFADSGAALSKVAATGGAVTKVTGLDPTRGENAHYWPVWLTDGKRLLFYLRSSTHPENNGIYIAPVDGSAPPSRLLASASSGLIAEHPWSGETYLLWVRDGDLLAQRFDQDATRLLGETSVIARDVRVDESQRLAFVSASSNGVIVWGTGRAAATVFAHYRRDGARRVLNVPPPGTFSQPALSPDGRRLLFTRVDKGQADIYMHDLESGTTRPVTLAPQYDELSTWTPDGRSALHLGFRQEGYTIFRVSLEEGSEPVARFRSDSRLTQSFETPDGRFLITAATAAGDPALLAVPLNGSGRPVTLAAGAVAAGLSADGRWLIMATVRGARVTPGIARLYLEGASPRIGVLVPIEDAVAIRNDAREVYVYASNRELKAVPIVISEHSASVGPPQTIVSLSQALALTVSGDGQQIVAIEQPYAVGQTLRVLTHWEQRLAK